MGFTAPFKEFPSHFAHSRRAASNGRDRTNPRVYNELRMGLLPRQTRASLSPGTLTAIKRTLPQPASSASVGQFLMRAGGGSRGGDVLLFNPLTTPVRRRRHRTAGCRGHGSSFCTAVTVHKWYDSKQSITASLATRRGTRVRHQTNAVLPAGQNEKNPISRKSH